MKFKKPNLLVAAIGETQNNHEPGYEHLQADSGIPLYSTIFYPAQQLCLAETEDCTSNFLGFCFVSLIVLRNGRLYFQLCESM